MIRFDTTSRTLRRYALSLVVVVAAGCAQAPSGPSSGDATPLSKTHPPGKEATPVAHAQTADHKHTNRLIDATSPYLLQHAHNPVDWYPWGPEALERAKKEDKPIFLSVGYSSCHWCHVMEKESFENEEIAAVMNEHFINIKVDREERPDIDEIYMMAVQAMTGSGGWPMSVFLTPDLKPFYGGTYFPPEDRSGMPGFKKVLLYMARLWDEKREEVEKNADQLTEHIDQYLSGSPGDSGDASPAMIQKAVDWLTKSFDSTYGGFGSAPKFPPSPSLQILLREYDRSGNAEILTMVTKTLDAMAQGGIYDHLGGGFARYSTDAEWLVPHFEKMLYDNAQLAEVYLEAYQVTKDPFYRSVVEETFEYIRRDMRDAGGAFYSAEDADSEGQEGKFYIWSFDEIEEILGADDAKIFSAYYNVQPGGNFSSHEAYHEGMNILHTPRSHETVAQELGFNVDELHKKMTELNAKMLAVRSERVRPGLDDKILTSWNALMISALAKGGRILDEPEYRAAAAAAADFILTEMTQDRGLLRTHRHGESRIPAYLDDYAYMVVALLDLYEATFDPRWVEEADKIAARMIQEFWDDANPGFYFTSEDHKNLIVRTRSSQDGAVPSGSSMAALGLLRLAKFVDNPGYHAKAEQVLRANHAYLSEIPQAFTKMLVAVDFYVYPPKEIAIAGPVGDDETEQLLNVARNEFIPNMILAFVDPASPDAGELGERIPLLNGKSLLDGKPAAYVCKNFACKRPVATPDALREQLELGPDGA